jgi:hypothetical protein
MRLQPRLALVTLGCVAAVAACSPKPKAPPPPPPPAPVQADATLWVGLPRTEERALRVAMMQGQLEIARRLVSEGAGEAASAHIARVVSEFYAPAKADYAHSHLSMDAAQFQRAAALASAGGDRGAVSREIDALLRQTERLLPPNGQWSKPGTIKRVLQEIAHQYGEGVQSGFVVNEERYQDAFGLALVARRLIDDAVDAGVAKDPARGPELKREAQGLVNMFPSAIAPRSPADAGEVLAQISRVELAFPGME